MDAVKVPYSIALQVNKTAVVSLACGNRDRTIAPGSDPFVLNPGFSQNAHDPAGISEIAPTNVAETPDAQSAGLP